MSGKIKTYDTTPKAGGYIDESLGQNETVCAIAHFHWWYSFRAWCWTVIPTGTVLLAYFSWQNIRLLEFLAVLPLIGLLVTLSRLIRKWTTEIGITSHRFVIKNGLIVRHTNEIALQNIEGVRVTQGLWGRMLDYGRLRIEGTGVDAIDIPDIADPVGFRGALETAKDMLSKR
jgi:hypothetical protein